MYIRIDEDYFMSLAIQGGLQRSGHQQVTNISGYAVVQAVATNARGWNTDRQIRPQEEWLGRWILTST